MAVSWTCHTPKYRDSVTSQSATVILIRARCDNPQKEYLSDSAVAVGSAAEHLPRPELSRLRILGPSGNASPGDFTRVRAAWNAISQQRATVGVKLSPSPHITSNPSGALYIDGIRYRMIDIVADHVAHGYSAAQIVEQYPDLTPGQVHVVLTYYYDQRG